MKILRISLLVVLSVLLLLALSVAFLTMMHEDLGWLDNEFVSSKSIEANDVSVRFMGNTNLLFSDGETNLLIDGWFSRPGLLALAASKIEPDLEAIRRALEQGDIEDIAAVIPVHSHYDHAMDSPEVARITGAQLLGSPSTANIARGWSLSEDQIEVAVPNKTYQYGNFTVTLIPSDHYEFSDPNLREAALGDIEITQPLVPPVKATDYKMGGAYSVYIQHPRGSMLVQGSAGFVPNALDALDVDVMFLGIGGLSRQTAEYRAGYWQHVVRAAGPEQIYPIHWDSLVDPLENKPVTQSWLFSVVLGFSSKSSLEYVFSHARQDNIDIGLLPMWQRVRIF